MGMFDAGKKKSENFKPLSEVEIQKKLYGTLRSPHLFDHQNDQGSPSNGSFKSATEAEKSEDAELFTSQKTASSEKSALPAGVTANELKSGRSGSTSGIHKWLDQESEVLNKNLSNPAGTRIGKLEGSSWSSVDKGGRWTGILSALLSVLGHLGLVIVKLFQTLGGSWKKSASKLALVGLVLVLILGIQSLNNQRENAMKNPKSVTAPKIIVTEQSFQNALTPPVTSPEGETLGVPPASGASTSTAPVLPASGLQSETRRPAPQDAALKPYVIQVATYVNLSDAEKMLEGIKQSSFLGFVQSMKRQNGRVYHCVFVGRFSTYEESDAALRRFKKLPVASSFPDVFIRKLK